MIFINNNSSLLITEMTVKRVVKLSECEREWETLMNGYNCGCFNEEYIDDIVSFEVIFSKDDIEVIAWIRDEIVWEFCENDLLSDLKYQKVLSDEEHEKWQNLHIKDANGSCLSPDEAECILRSFNKSDEIKTEINIFGRETDEYYLHLENELNIYNSLLNSGNVTNERYKLSEKEKEELQIDRRRYKFLRYIVNKTLS
jgi:hypothetical protein